MRRTLAFTALALTALAVASCQTWTAEMTPPPGRYVPAAPPWAVPLPPPVPTGPVPTGAIPVAPVGPVPTGFVPPPPVSATPPLPAAAPAPDPLDVRRILLEKKAKLLTLEAQKLALEKSLRDLRVEIAAEEKKLEKLPKSKAATKAKPAAVPQQHSVSKPPPAGAEVTLASQLEAILQRLDRLEKKAQPGLPAP